MILRQWRERFDRIETLMLIEAASSCRDFSGGYWMTFQRDLQPERMDDPTLPAQDHIAALIGLSRINRLTSVSRPIYRRLRRYAQATKRPLRVLDVATGSGDLPIDWARRARADGLSMEITAIDISDVAIEFAKQRATDAGVQIHFECRDCLHSRMPTGFDIVTCNLFIHHLDETSITRLLQAMRSAADHAVLVCDLERSRLNLAAVWLAAHAVTRSPVVHEDAMLSVRAALTRAEFREVATQALGQPVSVIGLPPCRYMAIIDGTTVRVNQSILAQAVQPA
jgi:2-polyprenyl-3-methyl-5-hydroxy-6-metoxy-1,4-benzoquinol methylase